MYHPRATKDKQKIWLDDDIDDTLHIEGSSYESDPFPSKITLLDSRIAGDNVGADIVVEADYMEVVKIPDMRQIDGITERRYPTHRRTPPETFRINVSTRAYNEDVPTAR